VQLLGPTRIANLQFLVPAMAVLLAAVFLGEPIQLVQVLGGATIVVGIFIARRDAPPVPAAELVEPA
jgi:drug/metabolite transporter (DMT)-like permease